MRTHHNNPSEKAPVRVLKLERIRRLIKNDAPSEEAVLTGRVVFLRLPSGLTAEGQAA